jgi:hypothetical protein
VESKLIGAFVSKIIDPDVGSKFIEFSDWVVSKFIEGFTVESVDMLANVNVSS